MKLLGKKTGEPRASACADEHWEREGAPCFRSDQQQRAAIKCNYRSLRRRARIVKDCLWDKYVKARWHCRHDIARHLQFCGAHRSHGLIRLCSAATKMNNVSRFG